MEMWKQLGVGAIAVISMGAQDAWATTVTGVQNEETSAALSISVDELSDVLPSDWAYSALQRLMEQYGCVVGYPDDTFRGDRPLTRYEFAALLEACLSEVTTSMAEGGISETDMATIQRLQTSFNRDLNTLGSRLESLAADTAALEANQFSTTTRLRSEVVFSLEQLAGNKQPGSDNDLPDELVFGSRARLNFNTSFTGQDLLKVRLDALNPVRLNAPITGTNMTRLAFDRDTNNDVDIGKLFYRFPVSDRIGLHIDATRGAYQANVSSTFNPGFANPINGAVSRFGRFNPIYYQGALGTGITGVYDISSDLTLSAGYLVPGKSAANSEIGLFSGGYTALGQLDFRPTDTVKLGVTYARSYYPGGAVAVTAGTGSRLANAPFGNSVATSANHFGLQSSVKLGDNATLSGWAGLSLASAESDRGTVRDGDDATLLNWALTLGLRNLGGKGHFGGLLVGQPPRVLSNDSGPDEADATWQVEAFYRYRVNQNVALIPGFVVLVNPENNRANDTIWLGSLRTVFEF
ncbi:iron uptake porin [Leptothoe sp. ISB3NOV94-8A]